MRPVRFPRTLAALVAVVILSVPAAFAQGPEPPTSRAAGYAALLPAGTQGAVSAAGTGPAERSVSLSGLRPAGGGTVGSVRVSVSAVTRGADGLAEGTVEISGVSLLQGRVSIASLRLSARSSSAAGSAEAEGSASGVVVDGAPVSVGPGTRVDVAGIGTIVFLEQVADGAGGVRANGVRLEVTDPQAAAVIGQPFVLGHLDLSTRGGAAPAAPERDREPREPRTTPARPAARPAPDPDPSPATAPAPLLAPAPLGLPRRAAPAVSVPTDSGYVFPVLGEVSFTDDYGAPRAGTGWHQGNDVFGPRGTPLLAVADGTLSKVGVNTLGGNRLWLTDDAGNAFYYAHLSAYAPAAVEGARVTAGQVIGFLGNTGQAITTPPHLHFEVHPGGGDSVNPYPYLIAWQRGTDIPRAFVQAATSPSPAPAVGAVLVDGLPELDTAPPAENGLATPAT